MTKKAKFDYKKQIRKTYQTRPQVGISRHVFPEGGTPDLGNCMHLRKIETEKRWTHESSLPMLTFFLM